MTTAVEAPEPVFVDTNVLVYAAIPAFPLHVVAPMLAHGIRRLLTHNVSDFVRFSPWVDILPLAPSP